MPAESAPATGTKTSLPFVVKFQVIVALLATAVTIGLAAYLPTLIHRKSQLQADITALQTERESLSKDNQRLTKERDASNSIANSATAALSPEQAKQVIEESLNSNPEAAKVLPRIFIHIRNATQRPKATELAKSLRAQGFIVPGVQILVNEGPDENQVRYFHNTDSEKKEAADIAAALTAAGILTPRITYVSNYPNIRPRQYEIWFTPSAL